MRTFEFMNIRWIVLVSLLLLSSKALAGEGDALPFSRIDRNPVTSAFAGAGAAFNGSAAFSAFSGAAMLPFYKGNLDASLAYQRWAPALSPENHVSAGAAYKILPNLGVALGYSLGSGTPYDVYSDIGQADGTFYPKNHVLALGVGYGITEWLSIGANLRYVRDLPAPETACAGVSADLFAAFQPNENLRFAAGVSTLGGPVASVPQPASAKVAARWGITLSGAHALEVLADADYYFSGVFSAAAGFQYGWNGMLFFRAGYRLAPEKCVIPPHLALGLGFHYYGFGLDVSYFTASPLLGNTFNLGLSYSF